MKLAEVEVESKVVARIREGLCVRVGFGKEDKNEIIDKAVSRIRHLRIFEDGAGKMNISIADNHLPVLLIPNFTLEANLSGRRPGFESAMPATEAKSLYETLIRKMQLAGIEIQSAPFGEKMLIRIENDGPATFVLDF